ncbi:hypothetical protein CEK62_16820 [Alcanivorax sp. N3-2A]|nr:hypothetical protein CEK62_16820 [Alcanivorax sp. N3-2A]|tara:strand:- start:80360 stop:81208 length:849 start_codon:yes stop_codon:yes gene_type:complete
MRLSLFTALALLLAMAGCDNGNDNADKTPQAPAQSEQSESSHQPPASPAPPQARLEGKSETLQRQPDQCQSKECPKVDIDLEVYAQQDALNQAVRAQLIRQLAGNGKDDGSQATSLEAVADGFIADAANLPDQGANGWELTGETGLLDQRGSLATIKIDSYEFTGGAHGMPATHWLNWDLAANQRVRLADIIEPGQQDAFWALAEQAHDQWLKDEADADDDFRKAWPFQKTSDFRITDDGIVLLYGAYTIGPYVMGMPELTLPREQLSGIVKERYLSADKPS